VPTHRVAGDCGDARFGSADRLFSLWLINRNLIEPIRKLIDYVTQLSRGRFAERVANAVRTSWATWRPPPIPCAISSPKPSPPATQCQ
jgi:hypothetical protein